MAILMIHYFIALYKYRFLTSDSVSLVALRLLSDLYYNLFDFCFLFSNVFHSSSESASCLALYSYYLNQNEYGVFNLLLLIITNNALY